MLIVVLCMTEDPPDQPFRLIKSCRGGEKLVEGDYLYDRQRRVGDVKHWQCVKRGICKARVLTKGPHKGARYWEVPHSMLHFPSQTTICHNTNAHITVDIMARYNQVQLEIRSVRN